ncbi:DUF4442 domain-containing protein [Longibacter salinarum]|uniref:DUF4442 domain-containing protein n=1 Tax=Longibacter salinarum TaxID=1850348 RepID=A0A2A8CXQ8_9BACT|nr:DUF4442 domain-containing protein [Longibacter salinarum]PEN13403.1 DUF4442 domain-containing protein [Longibacter salinarum]
MADHSSNPFREILQQHRDAGEDRRAEQITRAVGSTIPFMSTAGVNIDVYTPQRVVVTLPDRPPVHNHVGTPHAAALALLAEAATGLVVALNLSDGSVPLLRSMNVDFRRMARGTVHAEAALGEETQQRITRRPIGKVMVDVELLADGETAVTGALQWAWIPASRLPSSEG